MRIAVVNEVSACDKNKNIIKALESFDHEVINAGMTKKGEKPELTYIETGLLSALLLNSGRADLVVGGCGTGQGYLNSVMQYPNVICGLIQEPVDSWVFAQINGGNCISLALNKGYGWAGDVNLGFIFERLFRVKWGGGYPKERRESQQKSRQRLWELSQKTHLEFSSILKSVDQHMVKRVLEFPGVNKILDIDSLNDQGLGSTLKKIYKSN